MEGIFWLLFIFGVIFFFIVAWLMVVYKFRIRVSADEAAIIYGRKSRSINPDTGEVSIVGSRIISKGHGSLVNPLLEEVQYVVLQAIDIQLSVEGIQSKNGVKVNVEAYAVVKVGDDEFSIRKAATQFGDTKKSQDQKDKLRNIMKATLLGYLRSIISTLTPEELQFERDKLNQQVQASAGIPLASMGIEIVTFSVQNVTDEENYLDLLKKGNVAHTRRIQEEQVTEEKMAEYDAIREREIKAKETKKHIENKEIDVAKYAYH